MPGRLYVPKEKGRFCGNRIFCPNCWAYDVSDLWKRLDAKLFALNNAVRVACDRRTDTINSRGILLEDDREVTTPPPKLNGTTAILVRAPIAVPYRPRLADGSTFDGLTGALYTRTKSMRARSTRDGAVRGRCLDQRLFLHEGCLGGLETIGIRSHSTKDADFSWTVTIRQLLFVPSELTSKFAGLVKGVMPRQLHDDISLRIYREPSRKLVALLVAKVMQYDKMYLYGETQHFLAAMKARHGSRLTSTFGYLYGKGT